MTKEELQRLYKDKILVHSRDPYHFGSLDISDYEVLAYNPMCGDKFTLQVKEGNNVEQVFFHGFGCAVSKASTSILAKLTEGKSRNEIIEMCQQFLDALLHDKALPDDDVLQVLIELKHFEGRIDCIKLSWEALLNELKSEN